MKGVYVLIISLSNEANVAVGKLGTLCFKEGFYVYVGSAQVALEKRIARHLRREKNVFWHVDYLLQNPSAKILKIFTKYAGKDEECELAEMTASRGEGFEGFGCSDCRCKSHLYRVSDYDFLSGRMLEYPVPNPSTSS